MYIFVFVRLFSFLSFSISFKHIQNIIACATDTSVDDFLNVRVSVVSILYMCV